MSNETEMKEVCEHGCRVVLSESLLESVANTAEFGHRLSVTTPCAKGCGVIIHIYSQKSFSKAVEKGWVN